MNEILNISNLSKSYGGTHLLSEVNMKVKAKSVNLLTGDNGTGKSTLFNIITGFDAADHGIIYFKDQRITNWSPHKISKLGIARLFQNPRVFKNLTVKENIKVALSYNHGHFKPIDFFEKLGLINSLDTVAGTLSIGQQKLVSLCSILASCPNLLLLDEPLAGLDDNAISIFKTEILNLKEKGLACIIVEHKNELIRNICDSEFTLKNQKIAKI